MLVDALRIVHLLDDAVVHDRDLIGDSEALLLVMRHVDGRDAQLLLDAANLDTHLHAELCIEVRERLIHEKQIRLDDKSTGKGDTLALATGKLARIALLEPFEIDGLEHLGNALGNLCLADAAHLEAIGHIVEDRHVRKERIALEHEAEVALVGRDAGDVLAVEEHLARPGLRKAGNQAQRRGLAAARRAQQGNELSLLDRDVVMLQDHVVAVAGCDILEFQKCHGSP